MSVWHVSNHKLYSGTDSNDLSNPRFLVATEFGFDNSTYPYPYTNSAAYSGHWIGATERANRAAAGNSVHMWGNWFGLTSPEDGAIRMLSCFSQNPGLDYFMPNIDEFNSKGGAGSSYPRGQHSYVTTQASYVTNGHWIKQPSIDDNNNSASTDGSYINGHGGDSSYWHQSENYGNRDWHIAWLSYLKTGAVNGNYYSNNLAAWYLMDEPFNSNRHRDYESNQISVSGHSSFCSASEGFSNSPKMVGPGGHSNANDQYTAISGAIGIIAGNYYGDVASDTTLWWTPNMVAWMYSKISNETRKMVIPWLWGRYSDLTWSKYVFYGSLIEGARGVIWWMKSNDQPQTPDYSSYAHQRTAYGLFTNTASFNNNPSFPPDRNIFLSGTELPLANYSPNHGFSYNAANYYPKTISKATSIKAFSYIHNGSTRWRIYAVNHSNVNVDLTAEISGIAPSLTAYKRDSQNYILTTNLPNGSNRMVDTLGANACQFYDVGN